MVITCAANVVQRMMCAVSPELQNVAKETCSECWDLQQKYLTSLKIWLKKTPHVRSRSNDELLLAFLRRCRYNLPDTKKRIIDFYSMKFYFPEFLSHRVINQKLMDLYHEGIHTILLKPLDTNGPRIIISQYNKYDFKKTKPADVFKLLFILLEILANEDQNTIVAGVLCVIDVRDVTMDQVLQYDRNLLKRVWTLLERCLPIQFSSIHLINLRKEVRAAFNFVASFLPAKMPIKFLVHKKAEDLYQHLPRDALTVEYGGHNGYQREALSHWEGVILKYKDYFSNDDKYGSNQSFQGGASKKLEFSELTGVAGSFRKLDEN